MSICRMSFSKLLGEARQLANVLLPQQLREWDRRQPHGLHFVARVLIGRLGPRQEFPRLPDDVLLQRISGIAEVGDGPNFH